MTGPWNLPNLLSATRLAASPLLLPLAWCQYRGAFLVLFVFLLLTDWLDGKLAVAWKQRTALGARLDSIADAMMYGSLLIGSWLLLPEFVARQQVWLAVALSSFVLTSLAGLLKYGRLPSYHTWGAKISWFLTCLGALVAFAGGPDWPFRVAMVVVTITNLEATAITLWLPRWQADVLSLYHAMKGPRDPADPDAGSEAGSEAGSDRCADAGQDANPSASSRTDDDRAG